jgi:hypothetical protein
LSETRPSLSSASTTYHHYFPSEAFSQALLPSLLQLKERKTAHVWTQAEELFTDKVMTLPESLRSTFAVVTS